MHEYEPNEFWHCAVPHIFSEFGLVLIPELGRSRLLTLIEELEFAVLEASVTLLPPRHSFWSTHSLKTEFNTNPSGQIHLNRKMTYFVEKIFSALKIILSNRQAQ